MAKITGHCLCRKISFRIPDDLEYAVYCHCSECRRFSGSIFSVTGGVRSNKVDILNGSELISRYIKTDQSTMCFCSDCGSSLFVEKPMRSMIHIRFGALDSMPSLKPQAHVFVGSKIPWYKITDELPQFEEAP
ncbi:MAG: GFA family protein [Cellvibrionaceae bacterium]